MKKILFLTHHWKENSHHSKYSGYQALVYFAQDTYDCTVVTWGRENKVSCENGVNVHYVKPLMRRDFLFSKRLAISLYAKKIENQFQIVHALYSDCGFFQSHPNFYSTIHVSPFVVKNVKLIYLVFLYLKYICIEKRVIKHSRKVFVVARNLIPKNERSSKYEFVPHGVNTEYWSPDNMINFKYNVQHYQSSFVLCVGNHGVNKKLLYEAIEDNSDTNFIVVGLKGFNCRFDNLRVLQNISDDELKSLYMNCCLFIRPMDFATANNSILEALAMDCRILISTPNDFSFDYSQMGIAEDECFKEVSDNIFLDELRSLLQKSAVAKSGINRKHSVENFDWKKIWRMTDSIYQRNQSNS